MPSAKQGKSNNPPPSPSKDSLDALGKPTEDRFDSLEARISYRLMSEALYF